MPEKKPDNDSRKKLLADAAMAVVGAMTEPNAAVLQSAAERLHQSGKKFTFTNITELEGKGVLTGAQANELRNEKLRSLATKQAQIDRESK